ncbi:MULTISPECIES: magnesium transporter CorA family protein [unclassified Romboutsia]|uniref:magnesium transporter CorA family protein n=1 Tax=unclassified Romboutsia TaxID=2626894 RepID=UPI000820D747|nr:MULTISPECIES: CorA family divalent cation transporter [unclassified Romboutsia]SCH65639.1 Magnesium transport protein CorA [uncultured Clostridium sp.]
MHILDLTSNEMLDNIDDTSYKKSNYNLILCTPDELKSLKDTLEIDEVTFDECLEFDDSMKLDIFEKYDFISLNTYQLDKRTLLLEEINMYLSDKFILIVVKEDHFLYDYIKDLMSNKRFINSNPTVVLYRVNYLIFKKIMLNGFENLELIEDMILEMEDNIMNGTSDKNISDINEIRNLTRIIVKNTRPLLYIGDRILKEDIRYMKSSKMKKHGISLENLQNIDFGIDKLYSFAISTRELADRLLDIYSSQVAEKTNSLITKLTILTGIASPLTIITGIYGMNFKYMPELNNHYSYFITLLIMLAIVIVSLITLKIKKIL